MPRAPSQTPPPNRQRRFARDADAWPDFHDIARATLADLPGRHVTIGVLGEELAQAYEAGYEHHRAESDHPIPMLLWCPACGERHIDEGEFATRFHHTHACQECGMVWRPAVVATVGVYHLPGFKNGASES